MLPGVESRLEVDSCLSGHHAKKGELTVKFFDELETSRKIDLTRPKRLTRVEECMIDKYKVGVPVIKCLNWKSMPQSNGE